MPNASLPLVALLLWGALPFAGNAADNLLAPLTSPSAKPGDPLIPPWYSADGEDNGTISVKLGSPDEGKADWVRFDDNSPSNTANLRNYNLPPLAKGSFSFEIIAPGQGDNSIAVILGSGKAIDSDTRLITWRFSPGGRLRVGSRDIDEEIAQGYEPGVPLTFRCEFDLQARKVAFFAGDKKEPIKEIQLPDTLPPVDAVRVTSGQKGVNYWFIRNLVLTGD